MQVDKGKNLFWAGFVCLCERSVNITQKSTGDIVLELSGTYGILVWFPQKLETNELAKKTQTKPTLILPFCILEMQNTFLFLFKEKTPFNSSKTGVLFPHPKRSFFVISRSYTFTVQMYPASPPPQPNSSSCAAYVLWEKTFQLFLFSGW